MRSPDEWDAIALTFAEPVGYGKKDLKMGADRRRVVNLGVMGMQTGGRWMK